MAIKNQPQYVELSNKPGVFEYCNGVIVEALCSNLRINRNEQDKVTGLVCALDPNVLCELTTEKDSEHCGYGQDRKLREQTSHLFRYSST